MKLTLLVALLAIAAVCVSASQHVLYSRTRVPAGWAQTGAAVPGANVEFTLALKQRNLDILDKWFWEASDPTHKNYQQYKSIDEITDLVSPKPSDVEQVISWLHSAGVHHSNIKSFGDALDVKTTVQHAEKLFHTKFFTFTHAQTGAKVVRAFGAYSVPAAVKSLVEMVTGISTFPIPHLNTIRSNATASNDYGVVPQTLYNLYGVSQPKISKHLKKIRQAALPATTQAVIEFQGQNFANSDLTSFGQGCNLNIQALPNGQIVGPNDQTNPQTEATLDIQMIAAVDMESQNWFWLEQGNGWLYQFAVHFFGTQSVPMVNSISYGWWEGDQCSIDQDECSQLGVDSAGYVARVNTEFQKIGLRGITLISASGDSGANGRTDDDCTVPHLRPSFPGSSPFITSVGATELVNTQYLTNPPPICSSAGYQCASTGTEQAVSYAISSFASGGGFSDINPQPAYQKLAVSKYLSSGVQLPPAGYFNQSGRAHPDVSAIGHNLLIVDGGSPSPVGGTSASAPIFAGVISLLNDASIAKTGKPLGFLNPFLYKMWADSPNTFNDVTVGDNICTEDGCGSSCKGYYATKGWDPVTGLGTPSYPNMLAYIQSGRHMQQ